MGQEVGTLQLREAMGVVFSTPRVFSLGWSRSRIRLKVLKQQQAGHASKLLLPSRAWWLFSALWNLGGNRHRVCYAIDGLPEPCLGLLAVFRSVCGCFRRGLRRGSSSRRS